MLSLISKATDRSVLKATKFYELWFRYVGTSKQALRCFFLPYTLLSGFPLLSLVYNHRAVRTSAKLALGPKLLHYIAFFRVHFPDNVLKQQKLVQPAPYFSVDSSQSFLNCRMYFQWLVKCFRMTRFRIVSQTCNFNYNTQIRS